MGTQARARNKLFLLYWKAEMKKKINVQRGSENRMVKWSDLMYLPSERYSVFIRNGYNS